MKFIDKRNLDNVGEGDIIINSEGKYMICYNGSKYQWMILTSGYVCPAEYEKAIDIVDLFKGSKVFKNDHFTLVLE